MMPNVQLVSADQYKTLYGDDYDANKAFDVGTVYYVLDLDVISDLRDGSFKLRMRLGNADPDDRDTNPELGIAEVAVHFPGRAEWLAFRAFVDARIAEIEEGE